MQFQFFRLVYRYQSTAMCSLRKTSRPGALAKGAFPCTFVGDAATVVVKRNLKFPPITGDSADVGIP